MKALYDYKTNELKFAIAQSPDGKTYQCHDGSQTTAAACDRTLHPPAYTAEGLEMGEIATMLDMAIADPKDAANLFRHLPDRDKPALKAAINQLPEEQRQAISKELIAARQGAQKTQSTPQANEDDQEGGLNAQKPLRHVEGNSKGVKEASRGEEKMENLEAIA